MTICLVLVAFNREVEITPSKRHVKGVGQSWRSWLSCAGIVVC